MSKKRVIVALGGLFALALLAGCGNRGGDGGTNTKNDFNASEYVELGDYENMAITMERHDDVTDEQVMEYVESRLADIESYSDTDKTVVENGDFVNLNYEGLLDGEPFAGGTDEDFVLEIGSGWFLADFEEQVIGHSVGEDFAIDVTFPEDYWNAEMAGKPVVFHIHINAIVQPVSMTSDTLTDEFVLENFEYATVQEFIDSSRAEMEEEAAASVEAEKRQAVIDKLREISTVESLPEGLLDTRVDNYIAVMERFSQESFGMSVEEYLTQSGQSTIEDFRAQLETFYTAQIEVELIMEAIAIQQNISVDEEGFQAYVDSLMAQFQFQTVEELFAEQSESELRTYYLGEKVLEWLDGKITVEFV